MFDKYRKIFDDLANNYAFAKLNEGGKPGLNVSNNSNRVKFKNEDQRNRIADVIINARPSQRKASDENNLYTSADSYSDMINKNYQPQTVDNSYNNQRNVQTRPENQRIRRE